jgi:hypothetical protein
LSEISCAADPETAAKRFLKFGKFLLLRLDQKRLQDRLHDAQLESEASVEITDYERNLAQISREGARCEVQPIAGDTAALRNYCEMNR